ncbi:MAG: hypothetical protein H6939_13950 [Burkholderiales bacterium]|nr:hypothetical protein [Burkholderiales bacterium]
MNHICLLSTVKPITKISTCNTASNPFYPAGKTPVDKYRSPRSQTMNTITAFSTWADSLSVAASAPPEEMPAKIP